jgi:hypothetical protein
MKLFDAVATLVIVALFFVALLLNVIGSKVERSAPGLTKPSTVPPPNALESPPRPLSLCKTFLQAAVDGNFPAFKNACFKEGDSQMKLFAAQPATKETFRRASAAVAPACRQGYSLEYLGSMRQQGSDVFLWKLVPSAEDNQFLVRLTLTKDGKVSGFFFQ